MRELKELDYPPVWTAMAVLVAWQLGRLWPWGFLGVVGSFLGLALAIFGAILMVFASGQMFLARTTVIPHKTPTTIVRSGLYAVTRNPIYLGDLLIFAGALVYFGALWALPLLVPFVWIIETRFILSEEARLRAAFPAEFDAWSQRTQRWINWLPFGNGLRR
ncbi:isoprenylcysteine carboxylmethyltransferase family protein [Rhodobacter sp. Har01]|uniref:methyltransferase family protein n=1 Tax=Rhodobacter sp. Har01 TaxID=2883999 RepID=UPI001D07849D|nr:isoprenylcysteine carboxylmethyltransferase family protein [Rhodobacter sp. Har01]MCB6176898.1 isoprenylcysteine carboxylmethyltransferase family protein [Rhodobacter sp. Har01]